MLSVACWLFVLMIYILVCVLILAALYCLMSTLCGGDPNCMEQAGFEMELASTEGSTATAVTMRGHRIDHFADWVVLSCVAWVCIIALIAYAQPFACCRRDDRPVYPEVPS